jgi:hypothetical protein
MAETHILQHIAMLAGMLWWTKQWLITRPVSRWRFAVAALSGAIGWVFVAFTATESIDPSGGVTISFTSIPLAYFAGFMAFVSVVGIILGLALWAEEETEEASQNIPQAARSALGRDD